MADIIDKSRNYVILEIEERIREIRKAVNAAEIEQNSAECEDCGRSIPEDRRRAVPGCLRCVECQERFEKKY
jgi:phage/conjugal plasmid C-4 type zinc finger TraR family protein